MTTSTPPAQRQYFLDWLRILAFALLVPYHVGMYYVSWDWHVKSAELHPGLEIWMQLSSPWRMGLLFLIAGAASSLLMQRQPTGFLRSRSKRLLWPLLFGMLVIVPPQAYYEVVTKVAYAGSYLDFMQLYLQAYKGFCRGTDCLILPTWNHLWFLPYLWVYSLMGWALLRLWPRWSEGCAAWLGRHGSAVTLLLVLALPLMAARGLVGLFPGTHNLVWDWYNHAQYLPLFLTGLLLAQSSFWELAQRHRWAASGLAVLAWALVMLYFHHYREAAPPEALRWVQRALYGAMQWWCLVALCGHARQHLNVEHRWRAALTSAVFCVYILHQTVIVLLTRLLLPLGLPAAIEGPLLIVLCFALCAVGYVLARRVPGLRLLLGISSSGRTDPGGLSGAASHRTRPARHQTSG
ncbi:MAG: acyltransferase family protein [Burkholderiaceae bacterium]|nr:acyltransferase family protein [Burkholderiaceae bacterium]